MGLTYSNTNNYLLGSHKNSMDPKYSREAFSKDLPAYMSHGESELFKEDLTALAALPPVRLLCWVMTSPENHATRAAAVNATWAPRCDRTIFMSSEVAHDLDSLAVVAEEGRQALWAKTKAAYSYIYDNLIDDYDWFLKADDDTYVVVENLRYLLR